MGIERGEMEAAVLPLFEVDFLEGDFLAGDFSAFSSFASAFFSTFAALGFSFFGELVSVIELNAGIVGVAVVVVAPKGDGADVDGMPAKDEEDGIEREGNDVEEELPVVLLLLLKPKRGVGVVVCNWVGNEKKGEGTEGLVGWGAKLKPEEREENEAGTVDDVVGGPTAIDLRGAFQAFTLGNA